MRKRSFVPIVLLLTVGIILFAFDTASALDAPHNASNTMTCATYCHAAGSQPWKSIPTGTPTIDNTYANNLCKSCHISGSPYVVSAEKQDVQTHSSVQTSGNYGQWSMECRTCHNPHYQKQISTYPTATMASLVTGTIIAVPNTYQMRVQVASSMSASAYAGYMIMPDINSPFLLYQIIDNEGGTTPLITVSSQDPLNTFYVVPNAVFSIRYNGLIKEAITTPNSGSKSVEFFNRTGLKSFASSTGAPVNGVCQVCHTKTRYFRADGAMPFPDHNDKFGTNCTTCHKHNVGFKADCTMCHGAPPVINTAGPPQGLVLTGGTNSTGSKFAGAHARHSNSLGYSCAQCHLFASGSGTIHNDGTFRIKMGFYPLENAQLKGGRYDGQTTATYTATDGSTVVSKTGTMRCSNVYCHSSGQGVAGNIATPVYSNPSWTQASTGTCGTCHGVTGASVTTGNHSQHLNFSGNFTITCGDCHAGVVGTGTTATYNSPAHVNGNIDVAGGYNMAFTRGDGYGSCLNAAACHGNGTASWGTNTSGALDKCTVCHGTPTVGSLGTSTRSMAPPKDNAQNTTASSGKVGAHQAHMTTNAIGRVVRCNECHNIPAQIDTAGHIRDSTPGIAEVTFATSTVAVANSATTATYSGYSQSASGSCSNLYCHGAKMWSSGLTGLDTSPSWTDTNYINGTASHDCAQCHGYPPMSIGAHSGPVAPTTCTNCHSHVNASGTGFDWPGLHVNGVFEQPSGCNSCHGQSSLSQSTGAPIVPSDLLATGPSFSATGHGVGAHWKHVITLGYGTNCSICHSGNTMPALDKVFTMAFNLNSVNGNTLPAGGNYQGRAFNAGSGYSYSAGVTMGATEMCSNLYCHGSWGGINSGGTDTTPEWENSATGVCNTCHGAQAAIPPVAGAHLIHTASTTTNGYQMACTLCHLNYASQHVDGKSQVSYDTADSRLSGAPTPTYGGTATFGDAYSVCSNVYCHSQGTSPFAAPNIAPLWSSTVHLDCSGCHGGLAASANPINSRRHPQHVASLQYNYSCNECHYATTTTGTTITNKTQHVDRTTDVAWLSGGRNGDGTPYTVPGQTCSNIYCHSRGTASASPYAAPVTAVTWNSGLLGCGDCHGNTSATLTTGAHARHLATAIQAGAISCNMCHNRTTYDNVSIGTFTAHVNKLVTIQFNSAASSGTSSYAGSLVGGASFTNKAINSTKGTCNTTLCHGGNSAAWDVASPTIATCVKCHGVATATIAQYSANILLAAPGYVSYSGPTGTGVNTYGNSGIFSGGVSNDQKAGAHNAHLGTGTSKFKPNGIGCDDCHAVSSLSSSGHMNGYTSFVWSTVATKNGTLSPNYNPSTGVCSNVYCHGAGTNFVATQGTDTTPIWTDGTYLTTDPSVTMNVVDCNKCHQSPPINNGTYAHGGVSLTANACNTCHGHDGSGTAHIDGTLQYSGGDCGSCHDYDTDANGDWGKNPKAIEGFGAHAVHITHLKAVSGVTLSASADNFNTANFNAVCGVCHTRDSSLHSMSGTTNIRHITFGETMAYQFSTSGVPTYLGITGVSSSQVSKVCSNVSCHFQQAPVWTGQ